MRTRVVILYRFEKIDDTPVYIAVAGVSIIRKGKKTGGAFHFLLPAVYDHRENGYIPNTREKVLCMEDEEYYESISHFVDKRFKVSWKYIKVLKIKDINPEQ